jgi:predicted ATPase/DNA-binding XRE family transcriptional regulator
LARTTAIAADAFATFGELLKYLRRRAGLTQRELAIAVGYSDTQISRLEKNQRAADPATVAALFVPALLIQGEPQVAARLIQLAAAAREKLVPDPASLMAAAANTPSESAYLAGRTSAPRLSNLPHLLTSFVGRVQEMMTVKRLLVRSRLVTLAGAGGVGKTRLALQVAEQLVGHYQDGARVVEFAALADPELVWRSLAKVLGLPEGASTSLAEPLTEYLRSKHMLLVVDNCEHLVAACAHLAETLLRACPRLRILATSREALAITGETVFIVPSLSLPDPGDSLALENLMHHDAAHLFAVRAAEALPTFTLTKENMPLVVQICRRLDGIPLAIELAAARLRVLSLEQIAARLDDRFRLLTSGSRTALPRHHTLQAAISWSYDLLALEERKLLQHLAVFVGGCTLEAAEAIGAGDGIEQAAVLDILTQLVNKSLVIAHPERGSETRYRLLETIREYALARLVETGTEAATRQRHASFFLALAEVAQASHGSTVGQGWDKRLSPENGNFVAALQWSLENAPDTGIRLVSSLGLFFRHLSDTREGRRWLERAARNWRTEGRHELRADVLLAAAVLARVQGDYDVAHALNEECVAI